LFGSVQGQSIYFLNLFLIKIYALNGFFQDIETFKLGVLLKQARQNAGLTQEQVARKLNTTKSVVSRMENHATDIRLSTLERFASSLGKKLHVALE